MYMNNTVMDLSILNLAIAYVFVLVLLVIFKARGIRREKMILIATTRMTIQLTLMGFVLLYVFKHPSWWLTLSMLAIMLGFAVYNALKRVKYSMSKELKRLVKRIKTLSCSFHDHRLFGDGSGLYAIGVTGRTLV